MVKLAYMVIGRGFSEVFSTFGAAQERATELQFRGYPCSIRSIRIA